MNASSQGASSPSGRRPGKVRLDLLLVERGLFETREQARRSVMAGDVFVEGRRIDKAGTAVRDDVEISVRSQPRYVSRGGLKLEQALERFAVDPTDRVCLDIGASTGGFTDCLLQHGARTVYAVDVGYGQLHQKLRDDERVQNIERTNARHLDPNLISEPCSLLVMDVSFISIDKVLPAVTRVLEDGADFLPLIKPQFEGRREEIGKGGIVRDDAVRDEILGRSVERICAHGFRLIRRVDCETPGAKGNREALGHFRYVAGASDSAGTDLAGTDSECAPS